MKKNKKQTRYYLIGKTFLDNEFKHGFDLVDLEDFYYFDNLKDVKEVWKEEPDCGLFKVEYSIKEMKTKPPKSR